jgi:Protein of unknown function (DUF2530)
VSQNRPDDPRERRPAPLPSEADDRKVTATITLGWVLALVVLLAVRNLLPADARWWTWTCVCGMAMGFFGLWYVPFLKRKRARIAAERAAAQSPESLAPGSLAPESPAPESLAPESLASGSPSPEPQSPGAQLSGPASGYVSRDNGSNTVSSTETPGKSTRS